MMTAQQFIDARAKERAEAARVLGLANAERDAMLSARRTIDEHAPRALADSRERPALLQGASGTRGAKPRQDGSTPSPVTTHTDGLPGERPGPGQYPASARRQSAPSTTYLACCEVMP
jgi:hypothetical protein